MTLSVWRFAHLALAVTASLFLILASATGIILAIDAAGQKQPAYTNSDFEKLTLAEVLPVWRQNYLEVTEVTVSHNRFVTLKGFDEDGNEIDAYIDPKTGKVTGKPEAESSFIKWVTSLHRSLFMHEAGRLFVGINAFLLILIALSGLALVLQRQKGLKRFFTKITKDSFAQYYHVVLGRLLLIPILIIALTGTYLSMQRFKLFPEKVQNHKEIAFPDEAPKAQDIATFALFKQTHLADVQKIEFPFDTEDPEELFTLKLTDRELKVSQFTGEVLSEVRYPTTTVLETLSMDLHTGRTNVIWAIVLGIASVSILFFIYSGFAMTLRRRATRIKNKYKAEEATIVLLAGSENGSTLGFANAIHRQLPAAGHASYLAQADDYTLYPKATHLMLFTSTHGLGDAPSNARKFLSLLQKQPQAQNIEVSVVGFGSKAYPDFCGFALKAQEILDGQTWAEQLLPLHTVNDKSATEFTNWVTAWSAQTGIALATTPALYSQKPKKLQRFKVVSKMADDHTFILTLSTPWFAKYTSGDLLAIYPDDNTERLYSIGKVKRRVQLVVKRHENGLGSGYLNSLQTGDSFKARIVANHSFHLPKKPVVMVANGTGIAPFLGMFAHAGKRYDCRLYCGFRSNTTLTEHYRSVATAQMLKHHLKSFHMAFSREADSMYVMDLINRDAAFFASHLEAGGIIMLCGAIAMQQDVETVLETILASQNKQPLSHYKENGQLLADCY
ncbi:FAD-binding oxidoreductase [Flavobacterium akiainvivens]|uniref:FAD-binding oxidoreductase n=1 Tax=Flavobacterium akiainvivens TaxID=1202724 RepID=A0A0M9VJL1_9FLAO|nr:PepSY domain-containing protein [Flavobacterium akiainvivens]KOS07582.1 FAD-binding oxidoreductase [Flavobacterium akiainvivens]SFQ22140.1 sulfite reductase (NADPH) flavoprotein alpha-component [Flavobacterium akiainvivens]